MNRQSGSGPFETAGDSPCRLRFYSISFIIFTFCISGPTFSDGPRESEDPQSNALFPFSISFEVRENITNISGRLDAPAGKYGFIRAEGSHFVHDRGRIRFWGTNTCFAANFLSRESSDRVADNLARFGINCVRLHNLDSDPMWGGAGAESQLTMDPAALDRLDYFIAALKTRGIHVNLGLHVSRTLDRRDGFPERELHVKSDKGVDHFNRKIIEANKKFAADLLTHVNPYTKTAYKDEPAVAMIEISNENSIVRSWALDRRFRELKDPYLSEFRRHWNDWLKKKYGSKEKRMRSWKLNGESVGGNDMPIIWKDERDRYPKEALDDFCDFLFDLEERFWHEMRRFLKEEIKVRQPVSGTQLEFGSTMAQSTFDYCDIHGYWGHPTFPGRAWDGGNWFVSNRAHVGMMNQPHTTLPRKALRRIAGKPFTVSEYGHPFPNWYGAEGLLLAAAFGAFQDWDGIFSFGYLHSDNIAPNAIKNYFMTAADPVKTAHLIACHALFCDAAIPPAETNVTVPFDRETERRIFKSTLSPENFSLPRLGVDGRHALLSRTALRLDETRLETVSFPGIPKDREDFQPVLSEAQGQAFLHFHTPKNGRGCFIAHSGRVGLFTGFVEEDKTYDLGTMDIRFGKTRLGWATFSATRVPSSENGRERVLLVVTGEVKNTGMVLSRIDENKYTIKPGDWGDTPILCEGVNTTVEIPDDGRSVSCYALDETGTPRERVPTESQGSKIVFHLKSRYKTLWYELRYSPSDASEKRSF